MFFGIMTSCNSIPIWNDLCMKDPSNCQMARLNIDNAESTMKILTQTLFMISRICELPTYPSSSESISHCHKGMPWSTREDITKKFSFLSSMFESYTTALTRERMFVVSSSIVIAAAIGAASVAATVPTAYLVAKSETARVTEEQNAFCAIDVDNGIHNNL